jgi:hypothetical protein
LYQERERERVKSVHATTSRPEDAEKLRKLRLFKLWRGEGYQVLVVTRRLKTTREALKKWAGELNFDLGGTL